MDIFRIFLICAFVAVLGGCRKKSESVAKEVREAGYAMTAEGWFEAVLNNDVSVLKKMVGGGFDEKIKDEQGRNGLHIAAESGSREAAEYLLNRGFSVDEVDEAGQTPLMLAVLADKTEMVKWLLRQGADPKLKDKNGFMALMLAVTNGRKAEVEELATYHREDLDSALLLAALVGKAEVIDALTNYGASVYARMEDGRTPLMLAAQNGHRDAVALLIDIGASRFATTDNGDSALSLAVAAGHGDIAKMIETGFVGDKLALESDEEVAEAMDEYLDEMQPEAGIDGVDEDGLLALDADTLEGNDQKDDPANGGSQGSDGSAEAGGLAALDGSPVVDHENSRRDFSGNPVTEAPGRQREAGGQAGSEAAGSRSRSAVGRPVVSLEGARISQGVTKPRSAAVEPAMGNAERSPEEVGARENSRQRGIAREEEQGELPLVMRHYRQRELPVEVREVSGGVASLHLIGPQPRTVNVKAGEKIPDSNLVVIRVFSRTEQGKLNNNEPLEVGIVEVEDSLSGQRREWIAGRPAAGHDPVAMVEDAATGQRYLARPGQRFYSEDGREFLVNDVRPSQLVIEEVASGEVRTLPLRGPKG
ncbi:ankyrin repeat domain-containing protein [Luteolibacter algae]|uniref:Ankyrin repeat domain-containing protein n=1 Tax=Luteolibacter algae TaxID=454151 RepID=A0ABW5D7T8_9BACT